MATPRTLTIAGRTYRVPGHRALTRMVYNGVATTPDGCRVEPDGSCQHGLPSWLILLGFI